MIYWKRKRSEEVTKYNAEKRNTGRTHKIIVKRVKDFWMTTNTTELYVPPYDKLQWGKNTEYRYRCYINWQSLTSLISSLSTKNLMRGTWSFARHKITWNWSNGNQTKINSKILWMWHPGLRIAFHFRCTLHLETGNIKAKFCLLWEFLFASSYSSNYARSDTCKKVSGSKFFNSSCVIFIHNILPTD